MGVIPTPLSFIPEPVPLVAHGIFFAVGWMLFRHVDLLPALRSHAARHRPVLLAPAALGSGPPVPVSDHARGIVRPFAARGRGQSRGGLSG